MMKVVDGGTGARESDAELVICLDGEQELSR